MSFQTFLLTALSLLAFAGNSLLCRLALRETTISPLGFALIRTLSAAVMLLLLVGLRKGRHGIDGNWISAWVFVGYLLPFTYAYAALSAGTGALLAFGAVQMTMLLAGWRAGEKMNLWEAVGLLVAMGGILALLLPGATAPPLFPAFLMLLGGIGWGTYSLRGKGRRDPLAENAGNFLRAAPLVILCCLPFVRSMHWAPRGILYAVLSGTVTSGIGYAIWYAALRKLSATSAATVQLSVPVITALISIPLLGEALTLRLALTSAVVLAGIALAVLKKSSA